MKLSSSGQAFFVHETDEKPDKDSLEDELIPLSDDEDDENDEIYTYFSDQEDYSSSNKDKVKVGSPIEEWSFGVGSLPERQGWKGRVKAEKRLVTDQILFDMVPQSRSLPDLNNTDLEHPLLNNSIMDDQDISLPVEIEQHNQVEDDDDQKVVGSPSEWSFGVGSIPEKLGWRRWLNWRSGKSDSNIDNNNMPIFDLSPTSSSEDLLVSSGLIKQDESKKKYYYRSLRPSSEQLKLFNLKKGVNKMVFVVDNRYLECNLFLWERNDKIVVTDIDGTITKSDVLGHIFTALGKDWAQPGVTSLFQNIKANGYRVMYLTARSIGTNARTKKFLANLVQDNIRLPLGPVMLSPDRLLHALSREVITKNPHIFKISCLSDIQKLFPKDSDPIYAGFGNQLSDIRSYKEIGIPPSRIFTINPHGEISVGNSNTTTYSKIDELIEHIFPPPNKSDDKWNDFQYWRTRMSFSLEDIEKEL